MVPEDVLYTEWSNWQNCDKVSKRQIRLRSCKKIDGIVFNCDKVMMIFIYQISRDVQENTLVSRECNELTRDNRPDRPDPISLDDIKYCDNQWGRFLKVDFI